MNVKNYFRDKNWNWKNFRGLSKEKAEEDGGA